MSASKRGEKRRVFLKKRARNNLVISMSRKWEIETYADALRTCDSETTKEEFLEKVQHSFDNKLRKLYSTAPG